MSYHMMARSLIVKVACRGEQVQGFEPGWWNCVG